MSNTSNHGDNMKYKCLNTNGNKVSFSSSDVQPFNTVERGEEELESPLYWIVVTVYLSNYLLFLFGHLRDFLLYVGLEKNMRVQEVNREGYVPLYMGAASFYFRNIHLRITKVFHYMICSAPSVSMQLKKVDSNNSTYDITKNAFDAINTGSFDYLGFADNSEKSTADVKEAIKHYGPTFCSTRHELGTADLHLKLESMTAKFVGTEDSMAVGMGFATNSTVIPVLVSKGCLILSDEFNHTSIILGCRLSGSKIKVFKHNNMKHLEKLIRSSIVEGQPRTHRAWRKIMIITEGIYSMDGTICNLPALIALKKKYKCYLYIDEAHSIGALGSRGRGVVEHFGYDSQDVDILMGTFSKSFSSFGGYIAGSKELIRYLKIFCPSFVYSASISPVYVSRIITIMQILMDREGTADGVKRIKQLHRNTRYFRQKLRQKGFILRGSEDSHVVPVLLLFTSMIPMFIHLMLQEGIAAIAVGYPATSLSRARFCLSATHTKEMLDKILDAVDKVGHLMMVDYSRKPRLQKHVAY